MNILDISFFESVRCVEMNEFLTVTGNFDGSDHFNLVNDLHVEKIDVSVEDGVLKNVIGYVRQKVGVDVKEMKDNNNSGNCGLKIINKDVKVNDGVVVCMSELSKRKRNRLVTEFHKTYSEFSNENYRVLNFMRSESNIDCGDMDCVDIAMDGHCVFNALGYFVGKNAFEMRKILYDACDDGEKKEPTSEIKHMFKPLVDANTRKKTKKFYSEI